MPIRDDAGESNLFGVFLNTSTSDGKTHVSDYDTSQFTASFDGVNCPVYNGIQANFTSGGWLYGFVCTGNYKSASDASTHVVVTHVGARSGTTPATGTNMSMSIVPYDVFQNTISGATFSSSGPIYAPLKNNGATIDQFQTQQACIN